MNNVCSRVPDSGTTPVVIADFERSQQADLHARHGSDTVDMTGVG